VTTAAEAPVNHRPSSRIERFKQEIYDEWQSPEIVAAYRTWNAQEVAWGSAATALIVARARVGPGMTVLDLASGHGEPALALAEAVGPTGHVTATDVGPALLAIAEERARDAGLITMTFRVADAHALPFPDGAFDRVTSRLGVMYFVELERALGEIRRVLKPGGRVTLMAWGPFAQPLFDILVADLFRYVEPPEPEPGTPSPFAFAEPGTLSTALRKAGLREVEEELAVVPTPFPGTPQQYWDWWWDMVPPLQPLLAALAPGEQAEVRERAIAALRTYDDGERVTIPIQVVVASGI
jgi:ubiquinone/menaquinone biosynthesis C-methylase UbiE